MQEDLKLPPEVLKAAHLASRVEKREILERERRSFMAMLPKVEELSKVAKSLRQNFPNSLPTLVKEKLKPLVAFTTQLVEILKRELVDQFKAQLAQGEPERAGVDFLSNAQDTWNLRTAFEASFVAKLETRFVLQLPRSWTITGIAIATLATLHLLLCLSWLSYGESSSQVL